MKLQVFNNIGKFDELSSWRLWGEEKVDDVIYTVYLRKVCYHSPSKSLSTDSEDDISHLDWETVRVRFVKGGSLEKLVECLSSESGELESTYTNVFLATYRTFATPQNVLNLLLARYDRLENEDYVGTEEARENNRRSLRQFLHLWLDQYPIDFYEPPKYETLTQLQSFCSRVMLGSELTAKVLSKSDDLHTSTSSNSLFSSSSSSSSNSFKESMSSPPFERSSLGEQSTNYIKDFFDIDDFLFAQQLTKMDCELFKRVIPHQCLGSIWSKKDRDRESPSVLATINQFNSVSYTVISTILANSSDKPSIRCKIIGKWIDIAQELRLLKNFSSLKAIISALQSNPIYRLKKTWSCIPRDKYEIYEELARIFSEDNNAEAQRELLVKEGTSKFADTVGENDTHLQRVLRKQSENSRELSYGTIPYLGTFLTDLTMIDTAIPDTLSPHGLINFEKRRKEFEVLAQIKLLQGAAHAYSIDTHEPFKQWFTNSVHLLDEKEAFEISCAIEGKEIKPGKKHSSSSPYHKKNDSIVSTTSSASSNSQLSYDNTDGSYGIPRGSTELMSSASSSSSFLDSPMSSNKSESSSSSSSSSINSSIKSKVSESTSPYRTSEFYIIRVSIESGGPETEGVIMYKSIMIGNNERTREVIRGAMMKHGLEGSPDNFTLSQILPDQDLLIPSNANVYYAINTQHDLNFVLRENTESSSESKSTSLQSVSTPILTRSKPSRDTSKARRKLLGIVL